MLDCQSRAEFGTIAYVRRRQQLGGGYKRNKRLHDEPVETQIRNASAENLES